MCSSVVLVLRRTIFHFICWIFILLFIFLRVCRITACWRTNQLFFSPKGSNCTVSITEVLFSAIPVGFPSGDDRFRLCLVHAALFPETTPKGWGLWQVGRERSSIWFVSSCLRPIHLPIRSHPQRSMLCLKRGWRRQGQIVKRYQMSWIWNSSCILPISWPAMGVGWWWWGGGGRLYLAAQAFLFPSDWESEGRVTGTDGSRLGLCEVMLHCARDPSQAWLIECDETVTQRGEQRGEIGEMEGRGSGLTRRGARGWGEIERNKFENMWRMKWGGWSGSAECVSDTWGMGRWRGQVTCEEAQGQIAAAGWGTHCREI